MHLISHNKEIENALAFLLEKQKDSPNLSESDLLDEAGMRFNLTPLESIQLAKLFTQSKTQPAGL